MDILGHLFLLCIPLLVLSGKHGLHTLLFCHGVVHLGARGC